MVTPIATRPIAAAMSCLTKGLSPPEAGAAAPLAMLAEYTITRPPARSTSTTVNSTLSNASFLAIASLRPSQRAATNSWNLRPRCVKSVN